MEIVITRHPNASVAAATGNITHAVSSEFQSSLLEALNGSGGLVLDCSGIKMFTSAGLRVLLRLHRDATGTGKRLVLAAVPPPVRDVMEVTGFWEQFQAAPSVEEALTSLTTP